MKTRLPFCLVLAFAGVWLPSRVQGVELRAVLHEDASGWRIEYWSGDQSVGRSPDDAPAGVQLRQPGEEWTAVRFRTRQDRDGVIELGPTEVGGNTLRWRIAQKTPSLVERTLEVHAGAARQFAVGFPFETAVAGEFASFTGPVSTRTLFDTVRGSVNTETFPVVMVRAGGRVVGLAGDAPGLWENRCQLLLDPAVRRLAVLAGDGRDPYPLVIKPPEDARDTYQYQMDGWQTLAAGETRRFTTWVFASAARHHYDAQLAAHVAVANAKGWNTSAVEAILRNTSLFLLRRNLALDANHQPRDGRYIFISGPGYGWKQWVSDGFYTAMGLDDPEKTIESQRAVFWTRMDYEDNAQYYLVWAVLMKRAGGTVNEALVRQAYAFIRQHETNGLYVPPSLPGAPSARGWKTYHDVLEYDPDDCPASNQGFHCGALLAAKELGLDVTAADLERAIAGYRSLFNTDRGFMPTSRKLRDTLGQDTLYGATLTYAVFGRKLLTDEQVLTHHRTSERVKTPYGLRVISQADGSLLPGHSGVYCFGGSWFLNDAANYLLAGVHGLPAAEVDALLTERIAREIARVPAFNESISTVDGHPHGHILYSWNSGYSWLRREIRRRLGQSGEDPVGQGIDARLGVRREGGFLRLDPDASPHRQRASLLPPVSAGGEPRVLYNFDGDSCLSTKAGSKGPVPVGADDVRALIAEVAYPGSRVDTVLVCVNAQVMYYPTQVGTMRGALSSPSERAQWPASEKQRFTNLQAFFDKGVDPYAILLAEAKRRGREALLTFRMNDDHGNDFLRTQFMVDHPDARLGTEPYRGKGALDFGRDDVRDYTFRLIEEAVRRYDCDGLELDFNRFPAFFKDGPTGERVLKINSLVERIRTLLDRLGDERGHRLRLAVRVPSNFGRTPPTPESARAIGCDVPAWARRGWVDWVTVSEFLYERGDLPIATWKQAVTAVPVYGGIECTRGSGQKNLSAEDYRRAATELLRAGADGVYLFNFFTSREEGPNASSAKTIWFTGFLPSTLGCFSQLRSSIQCTWPSAFLTIGSTGNAPGPSSNAQPLVLDREDFHAVAFALAQAGVGFLKRGFQRLLFEIAGPLCQ
jgi:hypothetical protein